MWIAIDEAGAEPDEVQQLADRLIAKPFNARSRVQLRLLNKGRKAEVKVGTLDDTSEIQPVAEVWCERKQPWVTLPDIPVSMDRE